jgi:hypothetical protein
MKIKSLFLIFILWAVFLPQFAVASNYGDGDYNSGFYGGTDTPTPTPSPTAVPTQQNSNNSTSGNSGTSAPGCNSQASAGKPDLFEIRVKKNEAQLFFAPPVAPYTYFYIAYSRKADQWEYGTQFDQGYSTGVLTSTIRALQANTKYYFKIRSGNGCATGEWGNTMTVMTTNSASKLKTFYKNIFTAIVSRTKNIISQVLPAKPKLIDPLVTDHPTEKPVPTARIYPTAAAPTIPRPRATADPTPVKEKFCLLWWCF